MERLFPRKPGTLEVFLIGLGIVTSPPDVLDRGEVFVVAGVEHLYTAATNVREVEEVLVQAEGTNDVFRR